MSKRKLIKMQAEINDLQRQVRNLIWTVSTLLPLKKLVNEQSTQLAALSGCVAVPPPVKPELKGNDLCRAMLDRGDKLVMCSVGHNSDYKFYDVICSYDCSDDTFEGATTYWSHVVPVNNQGEPLAAKDVGL